jgi:hypothetical protein
MALKKFEPSIPDSRQSVTLRNDPTRVDPQKLKLGKQAARHDPRTLMLAAYATKELPPPPDSVDWGDRVKRWPMYLNDKIGDCTCAAAGHMIEAWSSEANGKATIVQDGAILKAYEDVSGYDPETGRNDAGAVELDVLKYWRSTGVGGHKIVGFVAVEPGNHPHIQQGTYLFGGCYIGIALPVSAQTQEVWAVPPGGPVGPGAPGSWGGHAVNVVAYDSQGLTVVTWGKPKRMTWTFWDAYCDEAYAILSQDFIDKHTRKAPVGLNLAQLLKDLKAL